ncbi:MAG TPA: alpha/beta fold hydrolase [Steroidobacteraceae bacterium]|nr:alpha/beta fold hydrolase [Steroidobacteraceae bacterium]
MQYPHPARRRLAACTVASLIVTTFASVAAAQSASVSSAPVSTLRRESGNLVLEGVPPQDAALAEKLARYQNGRQAKFLDWLPDGSMLVATRFGDADQVHRVSAPGGTREQLTFYPEPIGTARAPQVPNGDGFVFLKDRGGDENDQIYYYRDSDKSTRLLTDGKSKNGTPVWAHDGKRLAFYSNARDGVSYDIYIVDVTSSAPPRLAVGGQNDTWYVLDWSPDDTKLLLWRYVSINESYLFIADVATGMVTPLEGSDEDKRSGKARSTGKSRASASSRSGRARSGAAKVGITAAKFAPDGRGVYLISDEGGEFSALRYYDPVTHEKRKVSPDINWDVDDFAVSVDGRYVAWVVNEDGRSRLTVLDNQMKLELAPPGVPDGRLSDLQFDKSGKRLAFSAESAQSPRDAYVFDLGKNVVERWTRSEAGPVDTNTFVAAELVHYPTWDRVGGGQRMLSAYLYRPKTPGPHPVLISIHGGPESQYRPGYESFFQFLVNELGYAVIAPNVRGSSGYGKTFLQLDNGVLREDAVKDIGALLVWIGVQPMFDRDRVVVMGGSYGGYMALASLVAYSDRLRGGVDVVGISNFNTFLANTSAYRRDLRREEYGDERDPKMRAFFSRISPFNNSSSIRRPLLVVQGLNDPRVPASESEQMVARVRANGGEAWYLAAKDEGHGFRKKSNRDFYLVTTAMFLEKLAKK